MLVFSKVCLVAPDNLYNLAGEVSREVVTTTGAAHASGGYTNKEDVMFHVKRISSAIWLMIVGVVFATGCSDPMPMYASYKPANRAASERGWFPSSPQSATPPHEDEGVDESEDVGKSEGKSDANREPEHRLETAPTSALSGASSSTRGKGAGATEGGEVLAARGGGDARPSPQDQAQEVDTRIDLNRATQAELETLPGVGPATAKKIIAYRERREFTRTSQLQNVRGIGQKTYRKLAPLVKVEVAN